MLSRKRLNTTFGTDIELVMGASLVVRAYATSWKVAGSIPDEVNQFFFPIYLILPAALGPGVYSACNRN
jgi:hypothetical protein